MNTLGNKAFGDGAENVHYSYVNYFYTLLNRVEAGHAQSAVWPNRVISISVSVFSVHPCEATVGSQHGTSYTNMQQRRAGLQHVAVSAVLQ